MTWAELNEVRDLYKAIEDLKRHIDALNLSLSLKIPEIDGMPKSKALSSVVESITIRIVDAEKRMSELNCLLQLALPRLEKKLREEIKDSTARTLFSLRYLDGLLFRDISLIMGYSEAHIYYLHRTTGEKIISDWV